MASSPSESDLPTRRRELERLARMERVATELRALARGTNEHEPRPALVEAVHDWSRDVAAARRRLHAARQPRPPASGGAVR